MTTHRNRTFTPSRLRRILCSLFFAAAAVAALGAIASSRAISQGGPPNQDATAQKIAPWVIDHTANGQQAEFIAVLADQADLSQAATLPTKPAKESFVYDTIWNKSQTTQAPILQWLRERGIEHSSFYLITPILLNDTRQIHNALP